jgi:hypothetical protein
LSAIIMSAIMLNIVMLNGVMLNVIMLSVVAPILVGVISNGREPKKLFRPLTLDFQFNFFLKPDSFNKTVIIAVICRGTSFEL